MFRMLWNGGCDQVGGQTRSGNYGPGCSRVIRNLHYDELRKRRVRREYFAAEKRLSNEAGASDNRAGCVMIRLAFKKLPPETREVLCLVDIMGLKPCHGQSCKQQTYHLWPPVSSDIEARFSGPDPQVLCAHWPNN